MVCANNEHDAIAQLIVAWMNTTPAIARHHKINNSL